jgi:class 3 adenylate cyclase
MAAPPDLVAKIRGAGVVGERKPVTVLFADVVNSTGLAESMDAEEWAGVLNEAFAVMAQSVYRYEGTIAQLHGDGMLVFFGAPVAHEDDPESAVRAALDMVHAIERSAADQRSRGDVAVRIRVGVNTGPVVVAEVGNDLRYDYTAIGDTTNVAARIQAAAEPGQVLLAEATHRFVADAVDAEPLGSLSLKGKREPVEAYVLEGLG